MQEKRNKQAYRLAVRHYFSTWISDWRFSIPSVLLPGFGTIFIFYIPPLVIAKILSAYQDGLPTTSELIPYLLIFGGFWVLGEIFWRVGIHMNIIETSRAINKLYNQALKHLFEKDLAFFHDNFAGSLTKKTSGYATRYIEFSETLVFNIAPHIIPMVFIVIVLWLYSPWLVLVLLSIVALTISIVFPLLNHRKKLVRKREAASNKVSGHVADVYSNIDAVRAFSQEDFESSNHAKLVADFVGKTKAAWNFHNLRIDTVISPLYVLTNVLGLILALNIARNTGASLEVVFVTYTYYAGFTRFLWEFNGIYRRLESAFSEAAQFTDLLLEDSAISDIKSPKPFSVDQGSIDFDNVSFRYQDNEHQELFENFNLTIKPGEKVGLVGHSGGGKTTLTKLILRFMDIDGGKILIDGQDISKVRQRDLRYKIAYVPQDPYMFHRSINENIQYGRLDANEEDIKRVAKLSHSDGFIKDLPQSYETLIGERGVKLSGGQRQRIAVARAMIKDAPILLLDEATSALDSESEKLIQDALWKLMEGRTTIVIAHRLSTIQKMDRILVLENGKIVEQGSHKELLARNGTYSELWEHQSGGFLED